MPIAHLVAGLDFLRDNGATRAGGYGDQPDFYSAPRPEEDPNDDSGAGLSRCDHSYEVQGDWTPRSVRAAPSFAPDDPLKPRRFVDGKDVGRVVAYVAAPAGFLVPIRLSQIGAVALRGIEPDAGASPAGLGLRVQTRRVEKVVALMADVFPWDEIERFATGLRACGFRLLIARCLGDGDDCRDITRLTENARSRTREEMFRMERRAASVREPREDRQAVTITDGPLDHHAEILGGGTPFIGIVKSHANTSYLDDMGWATLYALQSGERTPAFTLKTDKLDIVTWYLRMTNGDGGPFGGIVRVELTQEFFEQTIRCDFSYIDRLSYTLCDWRTRDAGYGRAGVTLHPIQRAEDLLGAHFTPTDLVINRFYKISGL